MSEYDRYAPVSWGQDEYFDVRCPSGQVCQVRRLDMVDIIELDLVDKFDALSPVVGQGEDKKKPQDRKKSAKQIEAEEQKRNDELTRDLMRDKDQFKSMVDAIDKAVERAIVQPHVVRPVKKLDDGSEVELPHEEREKGVVYTSSIGFEDKMHIFDKVFDGSADLEPFREGPDEGVGDVD